MGDKHFGCSCGAVGMDGMEKVGFIDHLTAIYGGWMEVVPPIYGIEIMDGCQTGLTLRRWK
jgi:hypothetical protein